MNCLRSACCGGLLWYSGGVVSILFEPLVVELGRFAELQF